ncbi:hypothetical protein BAE44_0001908, partial [Dichanthelium oligosanthes]
LVRAAAVCKRWFRIARDQYILRRFRELHPPRLLGFYANIDLCTRPQFMPLSQAPEVATAIRGASIDDGSFSLFILDCRNGRLLVNYYVDPVHGKIYMLIPSHILELDLAAASISILPLPHGVTTDNFKLSCGKDSGLSLVHAKRSLLSIWHHRTSGNGECDWVLVGDMIRVHEAFNHHDVVIVFVVDSNRE